MRVLIALLALAALGCAAAIAFAGPGMQLGWWDLGTAFERIRGVSAPKEIFGTGFSLSPIFTVAGLSAVGGFLLLFLRPRALGVFAIIAALIALGAAQVPLKMRALAQANPFIHDITTDFDNPPAIIAAAELERSNPPEYVGDKLVGDSGVTVADAQRAAFPDLTSRKVAGGLDETAEIVRELVKGMKMEILDEGLTEEGWRIEAAYTSTWFGFIDDFVVRLTPEGPMTRVDVRSKSRVGGSDLGANAKRVRDFYDRLEAATS